MHIIHANSYVASHFLRSNVRQEKLTLHALFRVSGTRSLCLACFHFTSKFSNCIQSFFKFSFKVYLNGSHITFILILEVNPKKV